MTHFLRNFVRIELGDSLGINYGDDIARALSAYEGGRVTILDLGLVLGSTDLRQTVLVYDEVNQHWLDMVEDDIPRVLLTHDIPVLRSRFREEFPKIK